MSEDTRMAQPDAATAPGALTAAQARELLAALEAHLTEAK